MRGNIIIISSGILISMIMLIYNIVTSGGRLVSIISCLVLVLLWLIILLMICRRGRQWEQTSAQLEETAIQERRKQEEEADSRLRDMQEDVVWLKRQIAHGVRMPLAIISGYGDLLKQGDYHSEEEQKLYVDKICRNIDYLNQTFQIVIDDDIGKETQASEPLDLLEVAGSIVDYTDNLIRSHGVRLELNSSCKQVVIQGNRTDIMKMFYNLIENSLKYMECGDAIYITIEAVENRALIVYRDNGEGVTQQDAELLTACDYRGEQTQPKPEAVKGTGMGMYLVKDIIQRHCGTLQIKGGEGVGFAMYITIPLLNQEESLKNL